MAPKYDILVWGATGYSGRLVSRYLSRAAAAKGLTWAVAGRSEEKLARLQDELGGRRAEGVVVGDAGSQRQVDRYLMAPKYDILVWGATGYSGRLVSRYLSRAAAAKGLTWAVAGRSEEKLARLQDELGGRRAEGVVVGDAGSQRQVDRVGEMKEMI
ncbi:hypothetical protein DIPPA_34682 [Diplonema papillatum]|nr:hypothetical protein DIPPA_34682 [Diplonema papillatum]